MSSAHGHAGSQNPLAPKTDADLAWSHNPVISQFPVTVGAAQEIGLYDSSFTAMVFVYLPPDMADFCNAVILGGDKVPEDRYAPALANDALRFTINHSGKLLMTFGKDSFSSHAFCRPGMWEHIAFVYDKATSNQMIFINGREICSSIAAGKPSAAYTGDETVCFGQRSALDSFVTLSSWPGSMKEARIYRSAKSAHDIAGIAGIVPSPPPCVPLLLQSHPDQALILAPWQEKGDGDEMLNVCVGPAMEAMCVTFDYGCVRLADKPELALNIGSNRDRFRGGQHGTRLAFGRFHGDLAQRFQINYDGTISPQFQDACEGLVIGIQKDKDDYDYEGEHGEAEGTIILAKHFCGSNALKFQIPEAAFGYFPVGIPKPGKDVIRASLSSHPGKELCPNSEFQDLPPSVGLELTDIDDEDPLQLAIQGGIIRLMRGALDLLTVSTRLYYDNDNEECYEVMLSYYNSPHRGHKFKANGDGTLSAEGMPGLVVGLSSFRSDLGARLALLPEGHADAFVFEELVRSFVVTVTARPGANAVELADISCVDLSGKQILFLSMQHWESLGVLRRRCAEAAGVLEVSVKMVTMDGVALADTEMVSMLLTLLTTTA